MTRHCAPASSPRPLKFLVLHRSKMDEISIPTATVLEPRRPGFLEMQKRMDVPFRGAPHLIVSYVE